MTDTKITKEHVQTVPLEQLWKPIATAPRDGTQILVFTPSRCDGDSSVFVSAYSPNDVKGSGFGSVHSCCGYYVDLVPTHWMPVPDGPRPISQGDSPNKSAGQFTVQIAEVTPALIADDNLFPVWCDKFLRPELLKGNDVAVKLVDSDLQRNHVGG